jgi:hypothetical protein
MSLPPETDALRQQICPPVQLAADPQWMVVPPAQAVPSAAQVSTAMAPVPDPVFVSQQKLAGTAQAASPQPIAPPSKAAALELELLVVVVLELTVEPDVLDVVVCELLPPLVLLWVLLVVVELLLPVPVDELLEQ